MKKIAALAITMLIGLVMTGCVTPMAQSEVMDLTTCKNVSHKELKRSLVLNNFEIADEGDGYITTEFRQIEGRRKWQRITLVALDDNNWRFKVRNMNEDTYNVQTSSSTVEKSKDYGRNRDGKRRVKKGVTTETATYETRREMNESDEAYYQEHRESHRALKEKVCGAQDFALM